MESLENIRVLLEKFYQGETSLEEEGMLDRFFDSAGVPEEMLADQELFRVFRESSGDISVPPGMKQQIIESIDREAGKERRGRRISLYALSGLAAGIMAIIAVYLGFLKEETSGHLAVHQIEDTYDDPQLAYEEAKQTLSYISGKLNRGASELKYVEELTKVAREPLQSLNKMKSGKQELILLGKLQRISEIDN